MGYRLWPDDPCVRRGRFFLADTGSGFSRTCIQDSTTTSDLSITVPDRHRLVPEAFVILDPPNDSARVFAAAEIVEKPLAEP